MPQDPDWLALTRGDHRGLRHVYEAHAPALLRYGRQIAERQPVADAVQELFVRIWERRDRLDPHANPRAYLLVSLRNDLLRHVKAAYRTTPLPGREAQTTASVEEAIVAAESSAEREHQLRTVVGTLSQRERELIDLRFSQELPYEDIVAITGISYQSARNTLARAIGKLRTRLSVAATTAAATVTAATHLINHLS